MNQQPLILAIRAVSAAFALRIYTPLIIIASIILSILVIGCGLLVSLVSAWWWLLFAPVILLSLVFIIAAVVSRLIIGLLEPRQTKAQKKVVAQFVDDIQGASEIIQTPKFIIFFRLLKDMLAPGKHTFISEASGRASSLKSGLQAIIGSFRST